MQVTELDPNAMQSRIDELAAACHKMLKARPSDEVAKKLQSEVDAFKAQLPLLQEVRT